MLIVKDNAVSSNMSTKIDALIEHGFFKRDEGLHFARALVMKKKMICPCVLKNDFICKRDRESTYSCVQL